MSQPDFIGAVLTVLGMLVMWQFLRAQYWKHAANHEEKRHDAVYRSWMIDSGKHTREMASMQTRLDRIKREAGE